MGYAMLTFFLGFWVDLLRAKGKSGHEKDLEIALLRQQLRIVARRQTRGPAIPRWQKVSFAVLARRLRHVKEALQLDACLFKPDTLLRGHRALVRRQWTLTSPRKPGRPRIDPELEGVIVRLAKENPRFGLGNLQGELRKLGFTVSRNTLKKVLQRHGLPLHQSGARRARHGRRFLSLYQDQMLACDFFTVETAWLKTMYVLFFELKTRRVHFAGCTAQPDSAWVTQQAKSAGMGTRG